MRIEVGAHLDHFVGRGEERAAYEAMWNATDPESRVLCFSGLGGIGKSTLLEYFRSRHEPRRPYVLIDLAAPEFRTGYLMVAELATEIQRIFPALKWPHYMKAKTEADKRAESIRISVRQEQQVRGRGAQVTLSPQTVVIDSRSLRAELDQRMEHANLSRARLLDALCSVLADAPPFAIQVDTYEAAAHAADPQFKDWFDHRFVKSITQRVPQVRLVLAGREGFPAHFPRVTLEGWERQDSNDFLAGHGLANVELADAVFRHCAGHPLVTGLAVDVWRIGVRHGEPLVPDQLRKATNTGRETIKWLMEQLYRRLPGDMQEIVRVAVRLRRYQPGLVRHLLSETEENDLFERHLVTLTGLSLTEQLPAGELRAHDLIREVEDAWFRWGSPGPYREFHRRAEQFCAAAGDIPGSMYHGIVADEETFANKWLEAVERCRGDYDRPQVEVLISVLEAPERQPQLKPETLGLLRLEQGVLASARADSELAGRQAAHEQRDQAESLFRDALRSFEQAHASWGVAAASQLLGDLQVRATQFTEAAQSYETALAHFTQAGDGLGEANTLRGLGDLQVRTARLTDAAASFRQARARYRQIGEQVGEANAVRALGDVQIRIGRLAGAEDFYGQALKIFQTIDDAQGEANTLLALGNLQIRTSRSAEARFSYERALEIFRSIEDRLGEANALQALGELHFRSMRFPEAEDCHEQARDLYQHIDGRLGEADSVKALADVQARTGRTTEAQFSYRRALALYRQIKGLLGAANTIKALGDLQFKTDQLDEAGDSFGQALTLYRQIEDLLGEANTLRSLGSFYARKSQENRAEAGYAGALGIYSVIEDQYSYAFTLACRGQDRVARREATGCEDWRNALDIALVADLVLFQEIFTTTFGDSCRLLKSGTADRFLAEALLPLTASAPDDDLTRDLRSRRSAAHLAFTHIRSLAELRASGWWPDGSEADKFLTIAGLVDGATGSNFNIVSLTAELLGSLSRAADGDR